MKTITRFKLVPEEQGIAVTLEYTLNLDNADAKISQFDLNTIEAANQPVTDDNEIATLIVSGSLLQNSEVRKGVLSRGPYSLYTAQNAQPEYALSPDIVKALATVVEKAGFGLLTFGEGSGNLYTQRIGLLVGELLQLPAINIMSVIQHQNSILVTERTLESDVEVIELLAPAVLCVTSDTNVSRIPSMKVTLGVGRKPVDQWQASDIGWSQSAPLTGPTGIRTPPQTERKHITLDSNSPEAIAELAEHLEKALNRSLRRGNGESIKQRLGLQ